MNVTLAFILFFSMIFCHIADDYYLQGWLASAKQKKWWEQNAPDKLYRFDYVMALVCHSFSWSFMIMLPWIIYAGPSLNFALIAIPANVIIHAIVDDLKANKHKLNLIQDQLIHLAQIVVTFIACFIAIVV